MKQTQEQIEKLKSLQESLDWAIDLAENQLPELKSALQEIKDKVSNITIDLSPVAKEETLNSSIAALSALIEDIPSKVAVTRVTDLVATENDKEYIANDYGVDGFGKVKTELRNLVKVYSFSITDDYIDENGYWEMPSVLDCEYFPSSFKKCNKLIHLKQDWNKIKSLHYTFQNCRNLEILDVSKWDTSECTMMMGAFSGCWAIKELDVRNWDTSKCVAFSELFVYCKQLTSLDITNWDWSSSKYGSQYFVTYCEKLTTLVGGLSIEEVIANDVKAFKNFKENFASNTFQGAPLDRASLRAVINGIADVKEIGARTFPLESNLFNKLTEEDIAIATIKGWTIVLQ